MITREGIARLLSGVGVEIVGQADEASAPIRQVAVTKPDVAIVDIKMPPSHTDEGITAAQRIRTEFPAAGVPVLSSYIEPTYAIRLLEEHPQKTGYLLKERIFDVAILVDALRRIAETGPSSTRRSSHGSSRAGDCTTPLDTLTRREREVLELVAEGRSNDAIARALFVTNKTIEVHVTHIFAKLGIDTGPDSNRRVLAELAFHRT
jgi:serine/threonine-protein kinase